MVIITERFSSSSKSARGFVSAASEGSNCYFGFLLASDDQLSAELIAGPTEAS